MRILEALPEIDPVLEKFAARHKSQIEEHPDGPPNRVIVWENGNIGYSLSMILEDQASSTWHFWAAAWKDNEDTLTRRSVQTECVLPAPIEPGLLRQTLDALSFNIGNRVRLLNLRGRQRSVAISSLSPRV